MVQNMGKENINFQMEHSMKVFSKMINLMVKDILQFHKENIQVFFKKVNFMVKDYLNGLMAHLMKVTTKIIKSTDMENMLTETEEVFKDIGKTELDKVRES